MLIKLNDRRPEEIEYTDWYILNSPNKDLDNAIHIRNNSFKSYLRISNGILNRVNYIYAIVKLKDVDIPIEYPIELITLESDVSEIILYEPVEKPTIHIVENRILEPNGYIKLRVSTIRNYVHIQSQLTLVVKNSKGSIIHTKIINDTSTEITISRDDLKSISQLEDLDIIVTQTAITGQGSAMATVRLHIDGITPDIKDLDLRKFNSEVDNIISLTTEEIIKSILIIDNTGVVFDSGEINSSSFILPAKTLSSTRQYKMVLTMEMSNRQYVYYINTIKTYNLRDDVIKRDLSNALELTKENIDMLSPISTYITKNGFILDYGDGDIILKSPLYNFIKRLSTDIDADDILLHDKYFIDVDINKFAMIAIKDNSAIIYEFVANPTFGLFYLNRQYTVGTTASNIISLNGGYVFITPTGTLQIVDSDSTKTLLNVPVSNQYRIIYVNNRLLVFTQDELYSVNINNEIIDMLATDTSIIDLSAATLKRDIYNNVYIVCKNLTDNQLFKYSVNDDTLIKIQTNYRIINTISKSNGLDLAVVNDDNSINIVTLT
jgi:hypothetical protein